MITRKLSVLVLAVILAGSTVTVRASSFPVIQGQVSGVEVCAQSIPICGQAKFVGIFQGQVGFNPFAVGVVSVAVNHEPLPDLGETSAILPGGVWQIQLLNGRKLGGVVTGGELSNPLGDGTYGVHVDMQLTTGGFGTLEFDGFLSHKTLIPTWGGHITQ